MSRSKLEAPSAWGTCWTIPRRRRAARNPPEPFGFLAACRVEVSGTPFFYPSFPRLRSARSRPVARGQRQKQCYVRAKSVVFGVSGQTRPAALDGGRDGFDAVIDHIPIDHRTLGGTLTPSS